MTDIDAMDHPIPTRPTAESRPSGDDIERGNIMRSILAVGTLAAVLAFGAASAYANGPNWSPYELLAPQATQLEAPPETRASYTGDNQGCYPARVRFRGAWHNVQICD
jgi:hypothetical protein